MFGTFLACQCHVALVGGLVLRPVDKQSTHLLHIPLPGWEQRLGSILAEQRSFCIVASQELTLPMTMSVHQQQLPPPAPRHTHTWHDCHALWPVLPCPTRMRQGSTIESQTIEYLAPKGICYTWATIEETVTRRDHVHHGGGLCHWTIYE